MHVTPIATANLSGELGLIAGSKMAAEIMRLFEREPDLLLAYLRDMGRITPTGLAYVPGRSGYAYARNASERADIPASARKATAETPTDLRLWRLT